jgi:hypothetical protein
MGFRLDITDYPICAWEGYTFPYMCLFFFSSGESIVFLGIAIRAKT